MFIPSLPRSVEISLSLGQQQNICHCKRPGVILVTCTFHSSIVPNLFQHISCFKRPFYIHTFPCASNTLQTVTCNVLSSSEFRFLSIHLSLSHLSVFFKARKLLFINGIYVFIPFGINLLIIPFCL